MNKVQQSRDYGFVSIIIVNYNGEKLLYDCLKSVEEQEYRNFEIILVDNASKDNSIDVVRKNFNDVQIVKSETNLGFAGGNNLGSKYALGKYLVLLNNDTVVKKDWLIELLKTFTESDAGVVTSTVITENVPQIFYEMNGSVNYLGYNIMRMFTDRSLIFFAGGASIILKNDKSGNIFPDEYFLYQEDVFLSWRMRLVGKKVLMSQGSIVYHKGSATTKKQRSVMSTFYQERNRLLNTLIFYELSTILKLIPYLLADVIMKLLLSMILRRKSFIGILKSYGWIMANYRWVLRERKIIQSERMCRDAEILRWMSYRVIDADNGIANVFNQLSRIYSSIVGLQYYE